MLAFISRANAYRVLRSGSKSSQTSQTWLYVIWHGEKPECMPRTSESTDECLVTKSKDCCRAQAQSQPLLQLDCWQRSLCNVFSNHSTMSKATRWPDMKGSGHDCAQLYSSSRHPSSLHYLLRRFTVQMLQAIADGPRLNNLYFPKVSFSNLSVQ